MNPYQQEELDKFNRIGTYSKHAKIFKVSEFSNSLSYTSKTKTKKELFEENIKFIEDYIGESIDIVIDFKAFETLTKTPKKLIKDLLESKMIVANGTNSYKLNLKTVYCKACQNEQQKENYRRNETHNTTKIIREYDIVYHLTYWHYCYNLGDNWEKIPNVTKEDIERYISYEKPKPSLEVKSHRFEFSELKTTKELLEIKVRCRDCGYEPYIPYANVTLCTKEITN